MGRNIGQSMAGGELDSDIAWLLHLVSLIGARWYEVVIGQSPEKTSTAALSSEDGRLSAPYSKSSRRPASVPGGGARVLPVTLPPTQTAEAPVPEANVMPLPRSQVRTVCFVGGVDLNEMDVNSIGELGGGSEPGPDGRQWHFRHIAAKQEPGCGLPIETQVMAGSRPQASCQASCLQEARYFSSGKSTTRSPGATPAKLMGIRPAASSGRPMFIAHSLYFSGGPGIRGVFANFQIERQDTGPGFDL